MADEKMRGTFTLEIDGQGQVHVNIDNLPMDKVLLYGLLEVGKEAVSKIVDESKSKIQMPAPGQMRILRNMGNGGDGR